MSEEICIISIGDGWLDDDYTFYEGGKIKRVYDQHPTKSNLTDWITGSQISDHKKEKILKKCPIELKAQIGDILKKD